MRIKKIAPVTPANGNIENSYGTSQTDTYSQEYINENLATKDLATTSQKGLMSSTDKTKLNSLYKIQQNYNAWSGDTNKITLPSTYYASYLIITNDINGGSSIYNIMIRGGNVYSNKISGSNDTTFTLNNNELSIKLDTSSYWISFAIYLGNVS